MRRTSIFVLCTAILAIGIYLGSRLGVPRFSQPVHADQLDGTSLDNLYKELSQDGTTLQEASTLLAKIAAVTSPAVVHIQSVRRTGKGKEEETGSGVIMTSPTSSGFFVVTNGHVIDQTPLEAIHIQLHDGRVIQPERVWTDNASDVAVLKISGSNLTAARWGDSKKLEIGHLVMAVGSPFGLSRSVTLGIISAKQRRQ
ncbi:MAG: peptidase S1, partial [Planctomycetes bacterium]|nr:peptidase S1 [Planctomycetota bacterium]